MVNTIREKRNMEGDVVAYHLNGQGQYGEIDRSFTLYELGIGELVDGQTTITYPNVAITDSIVITPAPHDNDPEGQVGKMNYDRIKNNIDHTIHEHDAPATTPIRTVIEQAVHTLGLSIANIFTRLAALEAMFPPPIVYRGWVVEGQELRLNLDGSDGDDCIVGVHNGFGGLCPARIPGQPANSQERILTIEVNGAKHLVHIFSRGDTGRMKDAIAANRSTQTISTPPPAPTPEAG